MYIKFSSEQMFAVKIYVDGINIVSEESRVTNWATTIRQKKRLAEGKSIQDYLVIPRQLWVDGVGTADGGIKQFVALPAGASYDFDIQLAGADPMASFQFEITPYEYDAIDGFHHPTCDCGEYNIGVKTLTGKVIKIQTCKHDTGLGIKQKIQNKEGIPPKWQRLIFAGKIMPNGTCVTTLMNRKLPRSLSLQ